jgi:NAD(P)-dependent dehydrogenase (short-subunit alcohol dehydrogenase family)
MTHLDDKTALITGGGRGIGRAIALQLARRGVHAAVAARSETELAETTSAIVAAGGRAHAIVADLTTPGTGTARARRARDQLGRVDILINNAAVVAPLGASTAVGAEEFARAFTLNVTSVAELTFALLPGMLERRWGRVVNLSSGIVATPAAMVGANAYAATKAALEAHTVNLAAELAGTGVTVNAYRPGSVDTAMQAWIRGQDPDAIGRALHDRFTARHAAGHLMTPEASAAALIRRLDGDATGEIWDVADDTASRSRGTRGTELHPGDTFPSLTITPADADAVAAATGAFVNDAPRYLQSTGFVLDPEGRVIVSVYSSGAIGRLVPEDVIGLIRYVREQRALCRISEAAGVRPSR